MRGTPGAVRTVLERVVALLDERHVPHALVGAAALAAAGIARSTYDVDLLTGDATVLQHEFWSALRDDGIAVDLRRGDADDPLAGVVRFDQAGERPVDLIVGKHEWQQRVVARAVRPAKGAPIVTAADLVLLKLYAGGAQDLWDIRALLATPGGPDIARQVDREIGSLPAAMSGIWKSIR